MIKQKGLVSNDKRGKFWGLFFFKMINLAPNVYSFYHCGSIFLNHFGPKPLKIS